jgi:S1-C subfamily serine protease
LEPVNLLDVVLLVALLASALRGYRQGALAQVGAVAGAIGGLVVAARYGPALVTQFAASPGVPTALAMLALLLIGLVLGQTLGLAVGARIAGAVHAFGAGLLDRLAGIVVGLAGVVMLAWFAGAALVQGPSVAVAEQVRHSRIMAAVDRSLPPPPDVLARVGTYLDRQGFPQVFRGLDGAATAPPVAPPSQPAVAAAAAAGRASTVQVEAIGCGALSAGSGFVSRPGYVVTNAHVVAGGEQLTVRDWDGAHSALAVHVDPQLDLAVLSAPEVTAPPIDWVSTPSERGTQGATLGFPGGQQGLVERPASVRARGTAVGRDIYGRGAALREILTLSAPVRRGDSGGPFVTGDGRVGGVVFAAAAAEEGIGYALTAERVRPDVDAAVGRNTPASTGPCRF